MNFLFISDTGTVVSPQYWILTTKECFLNFVQNIYYVHFVEYGFFHDLSFQNTFRLNIYSMIYSDIILISTKVWISLKTLVTVFIHSIFWFVEKCSLHSKDLTKVWIFQSFDFILLEIFYETTSNCRAGVAMNRISVYLF